MPNPVNGFHQAPHHVDPLPAMPVAVEPKKVETTTKSKSKKKQKQANGQNEMYGEHSKTVFKKEHITSCDHTCEFCQQVKKIFD